MFHVNLKKANVHKNAVTSVKLIQIWMPRLNLIWFIAADELVALFHLEGVTE